MSCLIGAAVRQQVGTETVLALCHRAFPLRSSLITDNKWERGGWGTSSVRKAKLAPECGRRLMHARRNVAPRWGACEGENSLMPIETAIYEPPSEGLPYLVVTFTSDGMNVSQANSRTEARMLVSERVLRRRKEKQGDRSKGPLRPT